MTNRDGSPTRDLAGAPGDPVEARVVADLILFLVTFKFISAFLHDAHARWVAYWLALFGSGGKGGLFAVAV